MDRKKLDTLKHFVKFCKQELNIQSLPHISLINDKSFVEEHRSFGEYNPSASSVKVVALNRNLADVCRSLAHELVHHRQWELGMIGPGAGGTGSDIENDANAMAGIIMREYGKLNLSVYGLDTAGPINEVGEAAVTYPWKYDYVDDDENYFYSFNTPKNKYSVGISYNGGDSYEVLFNTEGEMGQDTGEGVAIRVLATVTEITLDFIKKVQPGEVILRPIQTKQAGEKVDTRRFNVYGAFIKKNLPSDYRLVILGDTYRILKK
jgi:hypothetical protein